MDDKTWEEWANGTYSWQPMLEKVKTFGGSSTVNKVYTNRMVHDHCQESMMYDEQTVREALPYLSSDKQKQLIDCRNWELYCWNEVDTAFRKGDDTFDHKVDDFIEARKDTQECLGNCLKDEQAAAAAPDREPGETEDDLFQTPEDAPAEGGGEDLFQVENSALPDKDESAAEDEAEAPSFGL